MNIKSVIACAAVLGSLATSPAQAGVTRISTDVEYADLDLTQPEGVATLEKRLQVAVRHMCNTYDRPDGLGMRPATKCKLSSKVDPQVEAIVARAKAELASSALAAR